MPGPNAPGVRITSGIDSAPGNIASTSAGSIVSSSPAARARSQRWTIMSALATSSTCRSTVVRPIGLPTSRALVAGSASRASTSARAEVNAASGSASSDGAGLSERPSGPSIAACMSMICARTPRASQFAQGDGADHRSGGTAATVASNASARRRYRCAMSLGSVMSLPLLSNGDGVRRRSAPSSRHRDGAGTTLAVTACPRGCTRWKDRAGRGWIAWIGRAITVRLAADGARVAFTYASNPAEARQRIGRGSGRGQRCCTGHCREWSGHDTLTAKLGDGETAVFTKVN